MPSDLEFRFKKDSLFLFLYLLVCVHHVHTCATEPRKSLMSPGTHEMHVDNTQAKCYKTKVSHKSILSV